MKKLLTIIFLSVGLFCLKGQSKYPKEIENKIKLVEQSLSGWVQIEGSPLKWTLEERMKFYKVHGLSIAVISNYKVEWIKCYGFADTAKKTPVTPETMFQIASVGKTINSLGVLKLVENKKVDLYTDINTYLTSWKFPYDSISRNKKITVAQLLSHSAGLSVHGFNGLKEGGIMPTVPQILDGVAPANSPPVRSLFAPNLKYQYSGGGTTISQLIVMDVSKQDYNTYMYNNVLKPIGMNSTYYTKDIPKEKQKLKASGYYRSNGQKVDPLVYPEGAGDLWSTPNDVCKYIIETQLSYLGKSNKVLSKEMSRLRLTPYIDSVGLGVFIDKRGNDKYFSHGGGNWGYGCQYYGSVEGGRGVVVMTNQDYSPIIEEIINSVSVVYEWGFYKPVIKKVISVNDTILNKYVGKYKVPDRIFTVTKKGNDYWYGTNGVEYKMLFSSETEFFNLESKSEKKFFIDEKGKLVGIIRWWGNDVVGLEKIE